MAIQFSNHHEFPIKKEQRLVMTTILGVFWFEVVDKDGMISGILTQTMKGCKKD